MGLVPVVPALANRAVTRQRCAEGATAMVGDEKDRGPTVDGGPSPEQVGPRTASAAPARSPSDLLQPSFAGTGSVHRLVAARRLAVATRLAQRRREERRAARLAAWGANGDGA
jgi:hypothetical protein